jgi:hypothetical protein
MSTRLELPAVRKMAEKAAQHILENPLPAGERKHPQFIKFVVAFDTFQEPGSVDLVAIKLTWRFIGSCTLEQLADVIYSWCAVVPDLAVIQGPTGAVN